MKPLQLFPPHQREIKHLQVLTYGASSAKQDQELQEGLFNNNKVINLKKYHHEKDIQRNLSNNKPHRN